MLVFEEGGKPENSEKNPRSKARTNNKLNPLDAGSGNRTRDTLVGGERSHHYTNPAPPSYVYISMYLPRKRQFLTSVVKFVNFLEKRL